MLPLLYERYDVAIAHAFISHFIHRFFSHEDPEAADRHGGDVVGRYGIWFRQGIVRDAVVGDQGDDVLALQTRLKDLGYYTGKLSSKFDKATQEAVQKFQADYDLEETGVADIAVDMADCGFVSSAGLRVIVAMQKRAATGGSLVFRNVVPEVMEVFEMTGFDKILTFE